jgi:myo-inositol-1(or 4)-monophosphatase
MSESTDLRLTGRSVDGTELELVDQDGNSFSLRISDSLRATVNQPRLSAVSAYQEEISTTVKEVQARLRGGESIDSISRTTDWSIEKVENFAGPILQERAFIIAQALATQMDQQAESLIVSALLTARPDDGIIAEEGAAKNSKSGITWVIDPLDGTVNYLYGLPGWNISIAAKDETGVIAGVVFAPTISNLWRAAKGGGAFLNNQIIKCNNPVNLDMALIATGFAYDLQLRKEQGNRIEKLIPKIRDIRRNGAAAVDLCYVAMGAVDGYFESSLKEWDFAAGGLIATEAGAIISGRTGGAPDGDMVVCAGPALHAQLLPQF